MKRVVVTLTPRQYALLLAELAIAIGGYADVPDRESVRNLKAIRAAVERTGEWSSEKMNSKKTRKKKKP